MKVRLLITMLLGIQIGLAGLLAARWWDDRTSAAIVIIDQPDVRIPDEGGLTLELAGNVVRRQATAWDPDARLIFASAQYDWPLDGSAVEPVVLPPGGWLTFVVMAPDEDGVNRALAMEVERYTGEVIVAEEIPWPSTGAATLPLASFPVSSGEALRSAEEAGGTAFRSECPGSRSQTVITLNLPPDEMARAGGLQLAPTPDFARLPDPPDLPVQPTSTTVATAPAAVGESPAMVTPMVVATPTAEPPAIVTPVPAARESSNPTWLVTYQDGGAGDNLALLVRVDAVTGEVLSAVEDIDGDRLPCGEET